MPLLLSVPNWVNQSAPLLMISGTLAQVSTLFRTLGLSHRPLMLERIYFGLGSPALPSRAVIRARRFAADEGAGALVHVNREIKAGAQDVLPEKTVLLGLLDGDVHILHRQGVFLADVDIALVGADGIGADGQPLEDGVGISFEEARSMKAPGSPSSALTITYFDFAQGHCGILPTCSPRESRRRPFLSGWLS